MGLLKKITGPGQWETWNQLANNLNGKFIEGGFWKKDKVVYKFKGWEITLDTFANAKGRSGSIYTQIRAPFKRKPDGFRFFIYKESYLSSFGKILGMQDLEVGHEKFDKEFIVQANNQQHISTLFSHEDIRSMITSQKDVHYKITELDFIEGVNAKDIDQLTYEALGVIKDMETLKSLLAAFEHTLTVLHEMNCIPSESPEINY